VGTIKKAFAYLSYLVRAESKHGVHSPFVFDLFTMVISNKEDYYSYGVVEDLRAELLADNSELSVTDLGAGSAVFKSNKRRISDIARHSLMPAKYGQLLFRLVNFFQPEIILELGSSLGVTTLYLALANKGASIVSIEGSDEIRARAKQNIEELNAGNVQLVQGDFAAVLNEVLPKLNRLDFVLFDGNHRKFPTLAYFEKCLEFAHTDSVFVFDDIHWSDEMLEAWEIIKMHERVTLSIDLFFMGIVFFRVEQKEKEHFVLRF
jgi:predicted O-methyltransferase YrrM